MITIIKVILLQCLNDTVQKYNRKHQKFLNLQVLSEGIQLLLIKPLSLLEYIFLT